MATSPASGPGTLSAAPSGAAGGDLSGTYPNPAVAALAITDAKVAAANKDGTAGTPSMRTLGTTALVATAGNDARLSDSRAPSGAAGGDLTGTYPNPTIGAGKVTAVDHTSAALMREAIMLDAIGILAETFPVLCGTAIGAATDQQIYCEAIGLRNGDTVTNILANVCVAGAGAQPTLIRQGIADSTGKVLAVTAASQASAQWTAQGMSSVALTAPLAITADGLYYLLYVSNGAFATPLQLRRNSNNGTGPGLVTGKPRRFARQTGQTDLPAVNSSITLATDSGQNPLWFACN